MYSSVYMGNLPIGTLLDEEERDGLTLQTTNDGLDGIFEIVADTDESIAAAKRVITAMVEEPEVGRIYRYICTDLCLCLYPLSLAACTFTALQKTRGETRNSAQDRIAGLPALLPDLCLGF